MNHPLAGTLKEWELNNWMFGIALRDMPETQAKFRVNEKTCEFGRIALHVLVSRHNLCRLLGLRCDALPWKDLGEEMQSGFGAARVPGLGEMLAQWNKLAGQIRSQLPQVSQKTLEQSSPMPLPGMKEATLLDWTLVNTCHESYHLGQLGLLLKAATGKTVMTKENVMA